MSDTYRQRRLASVLAEIDQNISEPADIMRGPQD
jgi:hypothetical protein